MNRIRLIPLLLLHQGGLYKSVRYGQYSYIGDPINAVKIFNEKETDELILVDADASRKKKEPEYQKLEAIAREAFMPMAYGGGIVRPDQAEKLFQIGYEKIIIGGAAIHQPGLIEQIATRCGSQSVVVSIDVKANWLGKKSVYHTNASRRTGLDPVHFAQSMESAGAGELIVNRIERDGSFSGYDLELIQSVSAAVRIPVIASCGAGSMNHFREALEHGASAVAASGYFVWQRPHNAVLITYPPRHELSEKLFNKEIYE